MHPPQGQAITARVDDTADLLPLDPAYRSLLLARGAIKGGLLVLLATIGSAFLPLPWWLPVGLALVPAVWLVLVAPIRAYRRAAYACADGQLRVIGGVLFRHDTIVPFGRVQHIDIDQGPVMQMFGLAALTVHTAGEHGASVTLPGLAPARAEELRQTIRAHIRQAEG